MGYFSGRSGHVSYYRLLPDGTRDIRKVAKVREWNLTSEVSLLPTNTLGDFADSGVPDMKRASGGCTMLYYRLEPTKDDLTGTYQFTALLGKLMRHGAIDNNMKIRLSLDVSDQKDDDIVFDAWITSARMRSAVGELVSVDVSFTMDGDYKEVINTALGAPYPKE